jgi:hypothetical protein
VASRLGDLEDAGIGVEQITLFMLTSRTAEMDIAVSANRLFLPISESQGEVWRLDQVDPLFAS